MEVVEPLLLSLSLIHPRQRRIAARLVDVQGAPPRHLLAQHPQPLPEEALLLRGAVDLRLFGDPPPQAVVAVLAHAFQLAPDACLRLYQPVFTVIGESLLLHRPAEFLDQVTPRVIPIFLIPPFLDPVVIDLVELAGTEVQPVRRRVVAEGFAVFQMAGLATVQVLHLVTETANFTVAPPPVISSVDEHGYRAMNNGNPNNSQNC